MYATQKSDTVYPIFLGKGDRTDSDPAEARKKKDRERKQASRNKIKKNETEEERQRRLEKQREVMQASRNNIKKKETEIERQRRVEKERERNAIKNAKWNPINNAKWNPINNAKWNAKRKEERERENIAMILADPEQAARLETEEERQRIAVRCYTTPLESLGGRSPQQALKDGTHSIYVGSTKRSLKEEAWRWLTERGANEMHTGRPHSGQGNRPVLVWKESGETVTQAEAIEIGFTAEFVYHSQLRKNVNSVEDKLQGLIDADQIPLGIKLHRAVAKGSQKEDWEGECPANYLAKVFLTICPTERVFRHLRVVR